MKFLLNFLISAGVLAVFVAFLALVGWRFRPSPELRDNAQDSERS